MMNDRDLWPSVQVDPEVVAAREAIAAHELEEYRLSLELGRAIHRAAKRYRNKDQ